MLIQIGLEEMFQVGDMFLKLHPIERRPLLLGGTRNSVPSLWAI